MGDFRIDSHETSDASGLISDALDAPDDFWIDPERQWIGFGGGPEVMDIAVGIWMLRISISGPSVPHGY